MSTAVLSTPRLRLPRLRLQVALVLAALVASLGMVVATPTRADAYYITPRAGMQVGFDGSGVNGHVWIKVTDSAAVQAGAQAAASAACTRLGVEGFICSQAVSIVFSRVDWRGGNAHGTWAEVYPYPYRTSVGRW